jgi:hypothetical protein
MDENQPHSKQDIIITKPPVWNPGPKIEIPHLENHVLKVFRFRFWKPRVWKSRPQSWDPKSWKPCPENHILKAPKLRSQVLKTMSWKFPKSFCLAALTYLSDRQTDIVDNFPQCVIWSKSCRAPSQTVRTRPDPSPRSALECPNLNFAHRLGIGNSTLRLAPGPGN